MSQKNVLLFIDSLENGGAQRQIVVLANVLHLRGYQVNLLTYYPGDQLSQFLVSDRIRRTTLPRHSKYDFSYFLRLYRYFRKEHPDCVISYLSTPNFWARLAGHLARVPRIITSERNINLAQRHLAALGERLLAPLSDAIVVNSHEGRQRLIELGIADTNLHVIYNGVDCSHFSRQPADASNGLRTSMGIDRDELLILLPGRMEAQKNHRLLVTALLRMDPRNARIRVAFAGNEFDTGIKHEITARIAAGGATDQFLFLGPRADMPLLYSAADLVVLPSLWEGFPNAVIEAMACGTPVIVSNISDNARIVEHGITGYLFGNNDADDLVTALNAFRALGPDQRRAMGRQAAAHIATLCSTQVLGDRYAELIELAPRRRHGRKSLR